MIDRRQRLAQRVRDPIARTAHADLEEQRLIRTRWMRREVKTGIENSDRVEIISGVKPGEMVVTSGQNGLPDGAKVTLAARDEK